MAFDSTDSHFNQTAFEHTHDSSKTYAVAWVLLCTFLVISMQLGFAMLEVGSVREAHRMTVLAKNIMDSCVSCLAFWAFCELVRPSIVTEDGILQNHFMTFHWAFCATCVTICSGSMAERTHMVAYLSFAALMAGLVYPVIAESAWGSSATTGILHEQFHNRFHEGYSYHDFAGSGVVHILGGVAALVGNSMLGRRIMRPENADNLLRGPGPRHHSGDCGSERSSSNSTPAQEHADVDTELQDLDEQDREDEILLRPEGGWPRRFDSNDRDLVEFKPLNYLQVMGMFTLWVGWYGFNAGSTLGIDRQAANAAGIISWNTTMGAASGGLGTYLFCCLFRKNLDVGVLSNGVIIGLVGITASCDIATPGVAALVGVTAGLVVYPASNCFIQMCRIDDPVDAVSLHLFGGLWGVLAASLTRPDCELLQSFGGGMEQQERFCAEGHDWQRQLVAQSWGALMEICVSLAAFLVLWGIFAVSERTRSLEVELLKKAEQLLCQMAASEIPEGGATADWELIVGGSPLARRILHRHGFARGRFKEGAPNDLWSLRGDLRQARGERAETALEKQGFSVCACLAMVVRHCPPLRELALLRLRISPSAELSGLGVAQADGGRMFGAVKDAMLQVKKAREDHRSVHSPLKREVRELHMQLRSQEAILVGLMRSSSSRLGSWRSRNSNGRLKSVPERTSDGSGSGSGSEKGALTPPTATPTPGASVAQAASLISMASSDPGLENASDGSAQTVPVQGPGAARRAPSIAGSSPEPQTTPQASRHDLSSLAGPTLMGRSLFDDSQPTSSRTVRTQNSNVDSNRTADSAVAGALSFHSNTEDTPPPSIGFAARRNPPAPARTNPRPRPPLQLPAQEQNVQDVLLNVFQAQQHLMSALATVSPDLIRRQELEPVLASSSNGTGTPQANMRQMMLDTSLLAQALQAREISASRSETGSLASLDRDPSIDSTPTPSSVSRSQRPPAVDLQRHNRR